MKKQPVECREIFANNAINNGLISKLYKQLIPLNIKQKQKNTLIKKWAEALNRYSPKKKCLMVYRHWKDSRDHYLLLFSRSVVSDYVTPWTTACQASLLYLLEFVETDVHWGDDIIQPYHPLPPSSPPALNLPQQQGLFQWVSSSHQVAKVSELQHQSFQWAFRVDFL